MDSAFSGRGRLSKIWEVFEAGKRVSVENDLVKVSRFVEGLYRFESFRVLWIEGESVGEMNFRDAKSSLG
jgi:hypothetical protein